MSSEDHRPSEQEVILSGASEPPKSTGFLTIAQELREMIYTELITSGDTAILRVSKQVHDEAKYILHKHGICRLRFSCGSNYFHVFDPPKSPLPDVQNFNLKIHIGHSFSFLNHNRITWTQVKRIDPGLQPRVQSSGTCHVTLVFGSSYDLRHGFDIPNSVLTLMRCLGTFKLVTLRAHFTYFYHPSDRRNRTIHARPHKEMITQMSADLETSLGDSDWKSEPCTGPRLNVFLPRSINPFPAAPYLEFHPPGAGTSQSKPGSTVLHV